MANPIRALAEQFVRRSPMTLLVFGIVFSLADFLVLYTAAVKEGVLYIDQGVGLLNNYGLFSTLVGNAVFPYLAKKYYDNICSMRASKAVVDPAPIEESLSALKDMIKMRREYQFLIYIFIAFGAVFWALNVVNHFRNPEATWGHKVFDSPDHLLTFIASRLHFIYTLIVLPFLAHVVIYSSVQLWRAIRKASCAGALTYDLLNPDRRGGFVFVDKAAIAFNVVVALIYIQITMHIETFKMNPEHVFAYIVLTVLLVSMNRMFLGGIYARIKTLRLDSLNKVKENVYKDDKLSFDILKYCYERRISMSSVVNFVINPGAIVISGIIKLARHYEIFH
jgi:hypothetical protein